MEWDPSGSALALQEHESRRHGKGLVCWKCPSVESSGDDRAAAENGREEELPPRGEDRQPQHHRQEPGASAPGFYASFEVIALPKDAPAFVYCPDILGTLQFVLWTLWKLSMASCQACPKSALPAMESETPNECLEEFHKWHISLFKLPTSIKLLKYALESYQEWK